MCTAFIGIHVHAVLPIVITVFFLLKPRWEDSCSGASTAHTEWSGSRSPEELVSLPRSHRRRAARPPSAPGEAGSKQGLRLPPRRPALVVGLVGVEQANERALLALGPQISIDIERLVYEHDIDVAAEAKLMPAEPAHPDDCEPNRQWPVRGRLDDIDRHGARDCSLGIIVTGEGGIRLDEEHLK